MGKGERHGGQAVWRPQRVYAAGGEEVAEPTGAERVCAIEGCLGVELALRWPDGEGTWVCTKALRDRPGGDVEIA